MNQCDANPEPPVPVPSKASSAGVERLTHWLIHRAARSAPAPLAERLEEEWLADLPGRPSTLSRLRFALGCCWATRVIAHEHGAGIALAPHAIGAKFAILYPHDDSSLFSRRSMILVLVVGLHIGVFYGLMASNFNIKKLIPSSFVTRVLQEPRPNVVPPPPPPTFSHGKVDVVIPEFPPVGELNDTVDGGLGSMRYPPDPPPAVAPHVVSRVPGGPGSGFPNTDDFYPSAAKRMEEQGVATVRVCVDANGRLTSDPTTAQSSGTRDSIKVLCNSRRPAPVITAPRLKMGGRSILAMHFVYGSS